jgi:hypothetical protein
MNGVVAADAQRPVADACAVPGSGPCENDDEGRRRKATAGATGPRGFGVAAPYAEYSGGL